MSGKDLNNTIDDPEQELIEQGDSKEQPIMQAPQSITKEEQKQVYETQLRLTALDFVLRGKGYGDDTLRRAGEVFEFLRNGTVPQKSNIHTIN